MSLKLSVSTTNNIPNSPVQFVNTNHHGGQFIALVSTDSAFTTTKVLQIIQDDFLKKPNKDFFHSLKETIEFVYSNLKNQNIQAEIASVFVKDNLIYASCAGGSKLLLLKNSSVKTLISSSQSETSGSGFVSEEDKFILTLSKAFAQLNLSSLKDQNPQIEGLVIIDFTPKVKNVPSPTTTSFWNKITSHLPTRHLSVQPETLDLETKNKKRIVPLVGVILIFLLSISIFFGISQKSKRDKIAKYEPQLQEAIHLFSEADSLKDLDPTQARSLALSAKDKAQSLQDSGIKDSRLDSLIQKISQNLGNITGVYEVSPEKFLDLSLVTNNFSGEDMALSGSLILVLDSNQKKLVGVDISSKKTNIISGPDYFPNTLQVAGYDGTSYILSSDGIRKTTGGVDLQIKPDNWSANNVIISAFAGNMYVLTKSENGVIYRYPGIVSGFAEGSNWFGPGVAPDLTNAVSMAIDGSVWILTSSGKILKFTQGSPNAFTVPQTVSISGATQIFTDENSQSLYILVPKDKKVVVISKEGDYKAQYQSDALESATKIVVSESLKKLIFLDGQSLYSIDLKHL